MSEQVNLKVTATGDVKPLETSLANAQKALAKTAIEAGKLDSKLQMGAKGSNNAAFALQNLGRIAQDAPFGFIGIANNINPLLESFQRLKAESGSTGQALKSLAGSLMGAGGLGLIVSLVSAAMSAFAMATRGSGDEVKAHKEKVDEAKKAADEYSDSISRASQSVISHQGKLTELNRVLRDTSNNFNILSKDIINQAAAQLLATQKEGIIKNILDAKIKQMMKYKVAVREYNADLFSKDPLSKAIAEGQADLVNLNKLVKDLGLSDIFSSIFKMDETKSAAAKRTISDVLGELKRQLSEINAEQAVLGINADDYKKKIGAIISAVKELVVKFKVDPKDTIIQRLFGDIQTIRLDETVRRIKIGLENEFIAAPVEVPLTTSATNYNDYTANLKAGLMSRLKALKIPFNPFDNVEGLQKTLDDAESRIKDFQKTVGQITYDTVTDMLTGVAKGLGEALVALGSGSKNAFGSLFSALFKSLGAGLQKFGAQMLLANTAIQALKKSFGTALGIPGAIAVIALGAVITALGSQIKVPAFANGVTNFRGGMALVGERGPELVTLPGGSNVIPNHELGGIAGGAAIQRIEIFGQIKGQNISLSNSRYGEKASRTT